MTRENVLFVKTIDNFDINFFFLKTLKVAISLLNNRRLFKNHEKKKLLIPTRLTRKKIIFPTNFSLPTKSFFFYSGKRPLKLTLSASE